MYIHGYPNVSVCMSVRAGMCVGYMYWGICMYQGFIWELACCPGVHRHTLAGGRVKAESGEGRWYTLPFPWHRLKTIPISQREFFVAKINFLI